jgi:hypothetical protein
MQPRGTLVSEGLIHCEPLAFTPAGDHLHHDMVDRPARTICLHCDQSPLRIRSINGMLPAKSYSLRSMDDIPTRVFQRRPTPPQKLSRNEMTV